MTNPIHEIHSPWTLWHTGLTQKVCRHKGQLKGSRRIALSSRQCKGTLSVQFVVIIYKKIPNRRAFFIAPNAGRYGKPNDIAQQHHPNTNTSAPSPLPKIPILVSRFQSFHTMSKNAGKIPILVSRFHSFHSMSKFAGKKIPILVSRFHSFHTMSKFAGKKRYLF